MESRAGCSKTAAVVSAIAVVGILARMRRIYLHCILVIPL